MGGIVYFFGLYFFWCLIWGFVCESIAKNRGYKNDHSFLWGFFLGIIGVIVVYSKPVRYGNDASISENEKMMIPSLQR